MPSSRPVEKCRSRGARNGFVQIGATPPERKRSASVKKIWSASSLVPLRPQLCLRPIERFEPAHYQRVLLPFAGALEDEKQVRQHPHEHEPR